MEAIDKGRITEYHIFSNMAHKIIPVSDRGQITLPKKVRDEIKVKFFTCEVKHGMVVLKPLKTREEFLEELEEASRDFNKHGGIPWKEVMKKAKLSD